MAIVRSSDGKYYDIDDSVLEDHEVSPENLPADASTGFQPQGGAPGGAPYGPPPGAGGPSAMDFGPVRVIINVPGGGGPQGGGVPQGGGGPAPQGQQQGGDVQPHGFCGWNNFHWNNWNNWNNWHNWHNFWKNWHFCGR